MESNASDMPGEPTTSEPSDLPLQDEQVVRASLQEQAPKQDFGSSMNGHPPDGLKNNWHSRAIMKNGKPRPSAVRDYPEEIGLRKPKTEGATEDLDSGAPETVSRKETKVSKLETSDHIPLAKSEKASTPAKKKPSIETSGVSLGDNEMPKAEKPVKAKAEIPDSRASESVNRKETKASNSETPDHVSSAKTEKAANLVKKKPSIESSEAAQGENEVPKAEKPAKTLQGKVKTGNVEPESDGTKKPAKPPPGKNAAVRDYPDGMTANVDQKPDMHKSEVPKMTEASSSQRQGDKRGRGREEDSEQQESSPLGKAMKKNAAKKLKESEQETLSAGKGSKAAKPSAVEKPSPKSKTPVSDKGMTKAETREVLESNKKETTSRRKSTPSTPSETNKKPRRSGGKDLQISKSVADGRDPRQAVLDTLRLYDAVKRKILRDEEIHGKQGKGSRADLQAGSLLKENGMYLSHGGKIRGAFPGLEVGDQFYLRMELCCIGMHGPLQGGIDYLTAKESEWNTPVAINIISIVGQDGNDNGDQLIYAGQGGRSADNKQTDDQKLERGNLAMDGSKRHDLPVRVVRGIKDPSSPAGKIYVYDGLYKVDDSYTIKGSGGFDEYRFNLQRVPGQPVLGSFLIKQASEMKAQSPSSRKDVVVKDICKGKENQPICVENTVNEEKGPADFVYSVKIEYPKNVGELESAVGCDCKGVCGTSSKCSCFSRSGEGFAYLNNGVLLKEKDVVFECGSNCTCSSNCRNRSTQKGLKFRLEIFMTEDRGWGVRSLESIPAGNFICEYTGKLIADLESVAELSDREHLLDLRRLPNGVPCWGDVSSVFTDSSLPAETLAEVGKPEFAIDASLSGNVARFINHSCCPNLFVQKVLTDHHDVRFPQIKLFAMDNIPPLRELTFCYGCPLIEEADSDINSKDCLCGSSTCRGKLYC